MPIKEQHDTGISWSNRSNKSKTRKGYFSSNRSGNDDMYSFIENRKVIFDFNINPIVSGELKYTDGTPIEGVAVEIYNAAGGAVKTVYSDKNGKYTADLESYKDYKLVYKKPGLAEKIQAVPAMKPAEKRDYSFDFINELEVIVDNQKVTLQEGDDLTNKLKLNPIYFDYNGFKIRESSKAELNKVVELMKTRPSISLKINSHTDSRGRDEFNMKLSENRAKVTVDYIVEHGIDESRVTGQGYGETRLINRCTNGVKCSEVEHQENRRSEFIIHVNN
ncbi:OmpA family protein [Flavobacterium sp. MMLR14_040]|uniref:OmpA family protein n=1 Tax=Flavobacterium sp. MMLR14_040 TaxID=3093843 RepID=UPI00298FDE3B|nr:OmpA family protein [Flavobacterium sp. MMLR14_040]MDW8852434.1 OmpA family protein [Flavobacterium sp. MMLR14_040]